MSAGDVLRLLMIVVGLAILALTVTSLAKRQMTESFCIAWGIVAFLFVLGGIILQPTDWNRYISWTALFLIAFGGACILAAAFYFSVRVSRLTREVRELAIQVSLLNQENAMIIKELTEGAAEHAAEKDEEKILVHH